MSKLMSVLLKTIVLLLAIPVLVVIVLIACWTLIPDEKPDPDAQRMLIAPKPVPAADNLYFAIMGFGASAGLDPHQVGVKTLEAFAAWQARAGKNRAEGDKAEQPGFDADPFLGDAPIKRPSNHKAPCQPDVASCLDEFAKRAGELDAALAQNKIWLDRYRALRSYPAFSESINLSLQMPLPRWAGILYISDLVDAEIVRDMETPATRTQALQALAAEIAFYKRLGSDAELLITRMMAAAVLERKLKLASELLAEYPGIVTTHAAQVAAIAQPLPEEWAQLRKVAEGEFRFMAASQKEVSADIAKQMTFGLEEPPAGLRWLQSMHGFNAYREQATLNAMARHNRRLGEHFSLPARDMRQQREAFQREQGELHLWSPGTLSYNPIGKMLVHLGRTSWEEYSYRLHDLIGLSRLVTLQRMAIEARATPDNMPELLRNFPALVDPYTNQPMHWDAKSGELQFDGLSSRAIKAGRHRAKLPARAS